MARAPATLPPASRSPATRRANRLLVALAGLLLALGGGAALAAGFGAFGDDIRRAPVLSADAIGFVHRNLWMWAVVGVVALSIAALALRWLIIQLRTDRLRYVQIEADRRAGETSVAARAVAGALAEEITSYPGVRDATVRLLGDPIAPQLLIRARLDGAAELTELRDRVETGAVAHAREALDTPALPVRLELRLASRARRTVR